MQWRHGPSATALSEHDLRAGNGAPGPCAAQESGPGYLNNRRKGYVNFLRSPLDQESAFGSSLRGGSVLLCIPRGPVARTHTGGGEWILRDLTPRAIPGPWCFSYSAIYALGAVPNPHPNSPSLGCRRRHVLKVVPVCGKLVSNPFALLIAVPGR